MKLLYNLASLMVALVVCSACGGATQTGQESADSSKITVDEVLDLKGEQRFEDMELVGDTVLDGRSYHYEIHRTSSDDLPMVDGDYSKNAKFHDNKATVKVTCGDRPVFSGTYQKTDFSQFVDADMMSRSVLRGFVFDQVADGCLQFAISVGYPQDDEMFVPILLKVKPDGSHSLAKDPMMDTDNVSASSDEEGV